MAFKDLNQEKQSIVANAAFEVFAKYGYKKASMGDIAKAAGISKSALFKYFSTKSNLYETVFMLASHRIEEADQIAVTQSGDEGDLFGLMRRSMKSRLALFRVHPWVYEFSYTAFFDPDPYVKELVARQSLRHLAGGEEGKADLGIPPVMARYYKGLRDDIASDDARQLILWVSMEYLRDKLSRGETALEDLEAGYGKWIDILEKLLKDPRGNPMQPS